MTVWRVGESGRGDLTGHVAGHAVQWELNHVMEFGTVVWSDGHGAVWDEVPVYAPEVVGDDDAELIACAERQGWTLLTGLTGQYSYNGPLMHPSEFVGGGLADHILATAGFYVTVAILADDDNPGDGAGDGWVIAYRLNPYNPDDFPQEKE